MKVDFVGQFLKAFKLLLRLIRNHKSATGLCTLPCSKHRRSEGNPLCWLAELKQSEEIRGRRDDFGTAPPEPVASFVTQFRDWCFSGELTQLAYQIPTLPLAT